VKNYFSLYIFLFNMFLIIVYDIFISIIISCIHCSLILQQYYEPLLLKCYLLIISEFKVIQEKRNLLKISKIYFFNIFLFFYYFNRRTYRNILYLINFLQLNHLLHLINILQVHIIHLQHWFDLFWYNHHI